MKHATISALALALLLLACTPAPSSQPAAEPSAAQCANPETLSAAEAARCAANGGGASNASAASAAPAAPAVAANNAPLLGAALSYGQWYSRGDEGTIAACYGAPESECSITIQCEAPTGKLTFTTMHELVPDQPTALRLMTQTHTLDLAARSFNEGLPSINADLADESAEKAALIALLSPTQPSFAVEHRGEITVYPWDEAIARTLNACR
jgi:hypothetical protein